VGEDEIPHIFERADICVLPYRDASQSGVVGIASDAGVPIVATPARGLTEQLQETGAVIADGISAGSLQDAIDQLLQKPELYADLSEKSIHYAKALQWDSISREFYKLGVELAG
jgi:glycosyltransferase involved in cell wall biosynthesis